MTSNQGEGRDVIKQAEQVVKGTVPERWKVEEVAARLVALADKVAALDSIIDQQRDEIEILAGRVAELELERNERVAIVRQALGDYSEPRNQLRGAGSGGWRRAWGYLKQANFWKVIE